MQLHLRLELFHEGLVILRGQRARCVHDLRVQVQEFLLATPVPALVAAEKESLGDPGGRRVDRLLVLVQMVLLLSTEPAKVAGEGVLVRVVVDVAEELAELRGGEVTKTALVLSRAGPVFGFDESVGSDMLAHGFVSLRFLTANQTLIFEDGSDRTMSSDFSGRRGDSRSAGSRKIIKTIETIIAEVQDVRPIRRTLIVFLITERVFKFIGNARFLLLKFPFSEPTTSGVLPLP